MTVIAAKKGGARRVEQWSGGQERLWGRGAIWALRNRQNLDTKRWRRAALLNLSAQQHVCASQTSSLPRINTLWVRSSHSHSHLPKNIFWEFQQHPCLDIPLELFSLPWIFSFLVCNPMLQSTHTCLCFVWNEFLKRALLRFILFVYQWFLWDWKDPTDVAVSRLVLENNRESIPVLISYPQVCLSNVFPVIWFECFRHRGKTSEFKKKRRTDFFVKEEEERRKKSQMQQSERGSYLEMEETQKGARETRRRGDRVGWQGVFLKQRSPFFLSLLRKVP